MAARAYQTATIAGLEGATGWSPIRMRLDVQAFGVNAWTAHEADTPVIPEHDEQPSGHEELYLVVAGRATFTVEGEEVDAPAGTNRLRAGPRRATRRGGARAGDDGRDGGRHAR